MLETAVDIAVDLNDTGPEEQLEAPVVVAQTAITAADGPVVGGHTVRLPVPTDAPPSAGSTIRWKVRAMADRAVGVHDEAVRDEAVRDVLVAVTPAMVGAEPDERVYGDGQVGLVLSTGQAARAGEALAGMFTLTTEKDAKFTELRVRLEARRADEDGIEHFTTVAVAQVAGKVVAEAGVRQELPFSIAIPADAPPTFNAVWNRLDYKLVASAARRMRSDFNAKLRVYVASSAPGSGEGFAAETATAVTPTSP